MAKRRLLVVEDDAAIRQVIVDALELDGYEVVAAASFDDGLRLGLKVPCDLALLDVVLPGGEGFDLIGELRGSWPALPVIMLTARGQEQDRVRGLKLGADDYVVKPFSVKELSARVEAVLRRSPERPRELGLVAIPGGQVDLSQREVRFDDGARVELADREVELLRYLALRPGRTVSREELLARVWHLPGARVRTRTVDVHVGRLREKLRDDGAEPRIIATVRGRGYVFLAEVGK